MELSSKYNPKEIETKWYSVWESSVFFTPIIDESVPRDKRFTIVIPPPNITGILHMGHALNNTIQDILIRYERMRGKKSLWVPGVDHAGIATQNVVEKKLAKEGKNRYSLGREKFIEEVWNWKEAHGTTIVKQLRRLGASCDWKRERFTMDEGLSRAVREAFVELYEKNLIYQGNYIINWCPRCQTALSDEETAHKEIEGALYHIRYPIEDAKSDADHIVVATTRPETMLGDTAVAVNSVDQRYRNLIGKYIILPLVNRRIPVIADDFVEARRPKRQGASRPGRKRETSSGGRPPPSRFRCSRREPGSGETRTGLGPRRSPRRAPGRAGQFVRARARRRGSRANGCPARSLAPRLS